MKQSAFQKWSSKNQFSYDAKVSWNAAIKKALSLVQRRNKLFEGNLQHEDIDNIIYDLKEMVEK